MSMRGRHHKLTGLDDFRENISSNSIHGLANLPGHARREWYLVAAHKAHGRLGILRVRSCWPRGGSVVYRTAGKRQSSRRTAWVPSRRWP